MADEKPEQVRLSNGEDFHFFFIVDRSLSMKFENRIKMARDAMKVFIQSLPLGCKFTIVSFGDRFEMMQSPNGASMDYNDQMKNHALLEIEKFIPNFGGTDILRPL